MATNEPEAAAGLAGRLRFQATRRKPARSPQVIEKQRFNCHCRVKRKNGLKKHYHVDDYDNHYYDDSLSSL
jgi:hypothetical protein